MTIRTKKTALLVLGVLTAVILIVSQLFCYQHSVVIKKEVKTEKQEKETSEQGPHFIMAAGPGLSSVQTQIHQEIAFLFEILFVEEKQYPWIPEVPLALGKYFQTLFQTIISPNAP